MKGSLTHQYESIHPWFWQIQVSGEAMRLYVRLLFLFRGGYGSTVVSQSSLAEDLGVSIGTIKRHLRELDENGLIERLERTAVGSGARIESEYQLYNGTEYPKTKAERNAIDEDKPLPGIEETLEDPPSKNDRGAKDGLGAPSKNDLGPRPNMDELNKESKHITGDCLSSQSSDKNPQLTNNPEAKASDGEGSPSPHESPPDRAPNHGWDPWQRIALQVELATATSDRGAWSTLEGEIKDLVRIGSTYDQLLGRYGEDPIVAMAVFAWKHWDVAPTWRAIAHKHAKIRADIEEHVKIRRGRSGEGLAGVASAYMKGMPDV